MLYSKSVLTHWDHLPLRKPPLHHTPQPRFHRSKELGPITNYHHRLLHRTPSHLRRPVHQHPRIQLAGTRNAKQARRSVLWRRCPAQRKVTVVLRGSVRAIRKGHEREKAPVVFERGIRVGRAAQPKFDFRATVVRLVTCQSVHWFAFAVECFCKLTAHGGNPLYTPAVRGPCFCSFSSSFSSVLRDQLLYGKRIRGSGSHLRRGEG